jgi:5-methyltetrahydrofolate--homocysteine methyltransferase
MACNGYEVIDMGVMVPAEKILSTAREVNADVIGLSGLITPSLDEMIHVAKEMAREGFTIPLLIGGATTSRLHTAVKMAQHYPPGVVHVLDASRSVPVLGALLSSPESREAFLAQNKAEQEAAKEQFLARQKKVNYLTYDAAKANSLKLSWDGYTPPRPSFTGARILSDFPLSELVPYIDWSPFFIAWELHGKFPAIFDDKVVGEEARKLYADAQVMLRKLIDERWITAHAAYGFWPAKSQGDDVVLENETVVHFLRQQSEKRAGEPNRCLSDFVHPNGDDYLGAFCVTAGIGVKERVEAFRAAGDDYSAILLEALADRLAEAFAEKLHEIARFDWGFGEKLTNEQLIKEEYRGIRPAPGYPACPDHTEKWTLFSLLGIEDGKQIGVSLTESLAMWPASSVSGWYLSHPDADYFALGKIERDQVESYATRKGMSIEETERWLAPNLAYDPE